MTTAAFRRIIYTYYRQHGRSFPWRTTRDPYRIFVSEIMLQQTQAPRVVEKYYLFVKRFPGFPQLARASLREIYAVWRGLGYNRRALYLKKAAEAVVRSYGGILPRSVEELDMLPGIGPATAASVAAFAYNQPAVFIETNIRAVFIHFYFPKKKKVDDTEIIKLVAKTLDSKNPRRWYNALMDYGTMLKEKYDNPNRKSRSYTEQSPFIGSRRQVRGMILKLLAERQMIPEQQIHSLLKKRTVVTTCLAALQQEGMVKRRSGQWMIA